MDSAIQSTSDDAVRAKEATVQAGYYDDPFVAPFASASKSPLPQQSPSARFSSSSSSSSTEGREPRHSHHPNDFCPEPPPPQRHGRPSPAARPRHVQPIIKRGTYARVLCVDRAITSFLRLVQRSPRSDNNAEDDSPSSRSSSRACQVVVLGAGKDTSYFRYRDRILHGMKSGGGDDDDDDDNRRASRSRLHVRWYDVDHDAVIRDKAATIHRELPVFASRVVPTNDKCYECLSTRRPNDAAASDGSSDRYFLLSFDLRCEVSDLQAELARHDFDPGVATLFISECLQMYLPDSVTASLLRGICATVAPSRAFLAMYEPILGADAFGTVMESNLLGANMVDSDSCLIHTRSLSQHLSKIAEAGFLCAAGCDMWTAYEVVLTAEQRQHANRCEFLDELEEFSLIMKHYCLVVASNDGSGDGAAFCSTGSRSLMGFVEGRCQTIAR